MKTFLLHTCCGPCGAYVIQELQSRGFQVTAFFYNPNIYPKKEYEKRKNEIEKYCLQKGVEFVEGEYEHNKWLELLIKRLKLDCPAALEPSNSFADTMELLGAKFTEGGKRCEACFRIRLKKSAEYAVQNNYQYFGTTLTISPHKNSQKINNIGQDLGNKYKIKFYSEDWKKNDGFKKSCQLSKKYNFYRQNYCGCEFSIQNTKHK